MIYLWVPTVSKCFSILISKLMGWWRPIRKLDNSCLDLKSLNYRKWLYFSKARSMQHRIFVQYLYFIRRFLELNNIKQPKQRFERRKSRKKKGSAQSVLNKSYLQSIFVKLSQARYADEYTIVIQNSIVKSNCLYFQCNSENL